MAIHLRWKKYDNGTKSAYLDIYADGKRKKKFIDIKIKKGDTDKKEKRAKAEAIRTKWHNDIIDDKYGIVSKDKLQYDFLKYFQEFIKEHRKAGIRKYKYSYEKFLVYLKDINYIEEIIKPVNRFSVSTVNKKLTFEMLNVSYCQGYKDFLYGPDSGLSGETPYDYFKRFKAVVNKAHKDHYLLTNPTNDVKIKKPKDSLKKEILEADELQVLSNTYCGNSEVKRAYLFATFTGMGEKEIRQLKWSNVSNGRLKTNRAKNDEDVTLKLSKTAKDVLGPKGEAKAIDYIFNLPSDVAVSKNLKNWVKKAGIEKNISFYCARHSFAILNLRNGANLLTISKLLGHTTTTPTLKYLNYLDAEKDKAIDNLPELSLEI